MIRDIAIIGLGGFGRETEWLISRINVKEKKWNFIGFIDNENDDRVIGDDDFLIHYPNDLCVAIAIGNGDLRSKVSKKYKENKQLSFPTLIDPSVVISDKVSIGKGNIICAGTIITVDIHIGCFNIINLDCTIGHDVWMEDYITINPSVNVSGNAYISSLVNIGTGTQIVQGKRIGEGTVIGAGAVVNRDIPAYCTAVGVPAKPIKFFGGQI